MSNLIMFISIGVVIGIIIGVVGSFIALATG
jgi:hypothetical protein